MILLGLHILLSVLLPPRRSLPLELLSESAEALCWPFQAKFADMEVHAHELKEKLNGNMTRLSPLLPCPLPSAPSPSSSSFSFSSSAPASVPALLPLLPLLPPPSLCLPSRSPSRVSTACFCRPPLTRYTLAGSQRSSRTRALPTANRTCSSRNGMRMSLLQSLTAIENSKTGQWRPCSPRQSFLCCSGSFTRAQPHSPPTGTAAPARGGENQASTLARPRPRSPPRPHPPRPSLLHMMHRSWCPTAGL